MDEHKDDDTVSAAAERTENERELEGTRQKPKQRIQEREKNVKLLQQAVEDISLWADKAVEDSEKIFTELIRLTEKRRSDLKQQIRLQQETMVKDLQEITELKRKDAEEYDDQFAHSHPSPSALSEPTDSSSINIRPPTHFEDVRAAVSELRITLQDLMAETWAKISLRLAEVDVLLTPAEPKTRAEFLEHSHDITLDPNTANTLLLLSEGNRKVTFKGDQYYSSHPDRFTACWQVLSRESLNRLCYWEVKWTGRVRVAVAYKSISRAGNSHESGFGRNDKSWALVCDQDKYYFYYNNVKTPVSDPLSFKVGVYLDHRAGILSFYSISDTDSMTLLHRFQTTFTQPLYAGLLPFWHGDTAELCKLK